MSTRYVNVGRIKEFPHAVHCGLNDDQFERFTRLCKQHGTNKSECLRNMVEAYLELWDDNGVHIDDLPEST